MHEFEKKFMFLGLIGFWKEKYMHIELSVISHINFRFFPIREGIETVATDDIWKLLYKHLQSHYPSLKQAFLQIDAVSIFIVIKRQRNQQY